MVIVSPVLYNLDLCGLFEKQAHGRDMNKICTQYFQQRSEIYYRNAQELFVFINFKFFVKYICLKRNIVFTSKLGIERFQVNRGCLGSLLWYYGQVIVFMRMYLS